MLKTLFILITLLVAASCLTRAAVRFLLRAKDAKNFTSFDNDQEDYRQATGFNVIADPLPDVNSRVNLAWLWLDLAGMVLIGLLIAVLMML